MDATTLAELAGLDRNDLTDPWQARAVALAVTLVEGRGLTWDDFRSRLIAELASDPDRAYYASWLAALESLACETGSASSDELDAERRAAATYRTRGDDGALDVLALDPGSDTVVALLGDVGAVGDLDPTEVRHLELHRSKSGTCAVVAFGVGGDLLIDEDVDAATWEALATRYVGAVTSPAPTIASRSTSAASPSTSRSSVPDGRSGSTK